MEQEKVWDDIAPYWNRDKVNPFGYRDGLMEKFILPNDKVLDLGCGSGRNFIPKGKWYGVDFSSEMLKFAKNKGYKELEKSELWNLNFKDGEFDKILAIASLHCVPQKSNRDKTIKEIYRVLNSKGRAIITVWNKDSERWKAKDKEKMVSWKIQNNKRVERYYYLYGFNELKKDLKKVRFKIVKESHPLARNIVFVVEK